MASTVSFNNFLLSPEEKRMFHCLTLKEVANVDPEYAQNYRWISEQLDMAEQDQSADSSKIATGRAKLTKLLYKHADELRLIGHPIPSEEAMLVEAVRSVRVLKDAEVALHGINKERN